MARRRQLLGLALTFALISPVVLSLFAAAESARESVLCNTMTWNGTLQTFTLRDDECFDFDLGEIDPATILAFEITISGDAIDILFFDDNGAQTYLLGQNYHLALQIEPTFEEWSDSLSFHWSTANSLAPKSWHMILDNAAHSGDEGLGDQGGNNSDISINITTIERDYYEAYHDMDILAPGSHLQIAGGDELTLDAGSSIAITAWPLEGEPDLYLMTDAQRSNYLLGASADTHIPAASLKQINIQQSLTWTVPQEYDGVTLHLMLDNEAVPSGGGGGSATARVSVSVIVNPILSPVIEDNLVFAVAELGDGITFDASDTPNRRGQIDKLEWDLDTAVDSDNDGDSTNDVDATGWTAVASYMTPGLHTISLKVTSPRGEVAYASHQVTVIDNVAPEISMSHNGVTDSDGHAVIYHDQTITLSVTSSDEHIVASTRWILDGNLVSNDSTFQRSWSEPGLHEVIITVSDASGNSASDNITVEVIDGTIPVIDRSACSVPVTAVAGTAVTLIGAASDSWDDDETLRYYWDLDPLFDGDGDGDLRNDADLSGLSTGHIFTSAGEHSIVLNVQDSAGNTHKMTFTIQVESAPDEGGLFGIVVVIVILVLGTIIVGTVGFHKVQERVAVQMLMDKGMTEQEAEQRLISIKSRQRMSIFANAASRAGLDSEAPKTAAQTEFEHKQALSQQLYGSAVTQDPNLVFQAHRGRDGAEAEIAALAGIAPVQQQAGGGRELSEDEFALMAGLGVDVPGSTQPLTSSSVGPTAIAEDEDIAFLRSLESHTSAAAASERKSAAVSGGIEIPASARSTQSVTEPVAQPVAQPASPSAESVTDPAASPASETVVEAVPESTQVKAECASCGQAMAFAFPAGVEEVRIDCPSCGVEQRVGR
ncbi:MAG TPA: hypothetical protein EYN46_04440 [Candidatus Poseidoniales archaeon]|nr:hypothetical protein [Candidatus Poseidoniales archaeon]